MKYFTLLQLNKSVQKLIDSIDKNFWITAEIAQFQLRQHVYLEFVQKEADQIVAKSRAMIWASAFLKLQEKLGTGIFEILKEGSEVLVQVRVTYHEVHGISLNVLDVDEKFTIGALELKRRETIQQLSVEGLLDLQQNLSFPLVPQRIAIISSKDAAGYTDFIAQLNTNKYGFHFQTELFEAGVQGQKALLEIISQLQNIDVSLFDAIAIIRGGGSRLDLEVFNEYDLAKNIALLKIPILTGIGHQKDETVSDIVANQAFKTPTAVAAFLINCMLDYWSNINDLYLQIISHSEEKVSKALHSLGLLQQQIINRANFNLNSQSIRLVELEKALLSECGHKMNKEQLKIEALERQINQLDPKQLLKRGFSITLKDGKPVSSQNPVKEGDEIESITSSSKIFSKVTKRDEGDTNK